MSQPPAPRNRPAVIWVTTVISLSLIGLAVVSVRDLATSQGWAAGKPWVREWLGQRGSLTVSTPVIVIAACLGLLGVVVLWASLKPGRRTHLATSLDDDLWLTSGAVAALARHVADRSQGVITAEASSRGRKITVGVVTADDPDEVRSRVAAALQRVTDLTRARISVKVTQVAR